MKTLKRISLFLLSVLLIFTFAGCDRGKVTEEETTNIIEHNVVTEEQSYKHIFPVKPVESEEASEIIEALSLNTDEYQYEAFDENQEIPLVYSIYEGKGYDIEGREFNDLAQLTGECSHCGKLRGIGENMCEGKCHISFNPIPSGSIVHPEDASMGPLY